MSLKNSDILLNSLFTFESYECRCMIDTENISPDEPARKILKLYADRNHPLHFAYSPKDGLDLTGPAGGSIERNILGKLLSLPNSDTDVSISQYVEFFSQYGFLLPLNFDEYTATDFHTVLGLINHVKATVGLMNSIGRHDHKRMLLHVAYLLFTEPFSLTSDNEEYQTCLHPFSQCVNSYTPFPDSASDRIAQASGRFSINDSVTGKKEIVSIEFVNAVRSGAITDIAGSGSQWFKNIVAQYLQGNTDENMKLMVDFFYHVFNEIGVFKSVEFAKITPFGEMNFENLSPSMTTALEKIARITIAEEINFNIRGIHPRYDGGRLTASWQINTLMEAVYFSVFYMKAGIQIYRECANPNCKHGKFFLVDATRTNKKYCCQQCANAAAAQRYRNRKL
jgi:hypothetical protein